MIQQKEATIQKQLKKWAKGKLMPGQQICFRMSLQLVPTVIQEKDEYTLVRPLPKTKGGQPYTIVSNVLQPDDWNSVLGILIKPRLRPVVKLFMREANRPMTFEEISTTTNQKFGYHAKVALNKFLKANQLPIRLLQSSKEERELRFFRIQASS